MGYTFTIGNATPRHHKDDFPYLSAEWDVDGMTLEDAPTFPGDEMTGSSNQRSSSYSVWSSFCKEVGLYEVFYYETGHLVGSHPGCAGITKEMCDHVTDRLREWKSKASLPAGFEAEWGYKGPPNFDYSLARLTWLEWWMRWALENCETPAIANY